MVKNLPPNAGDMLSIPKSEKSLVKETAASSSILSRKSHVQRIRGAEGREWGELQSMGVTKSWTQLSNLVCPYPVLRETEKCGLCAQKGNNVKS